ncbi:MAG: hypothetical protein U9Q06_00490 [Nanoarchaeota archaeon]|nr:hypothetical protein [Nanoarchaeota archaeon]
MDEEENKIIRNEEDSREMVEEVDSREVIEDDKTKEDKINSTENQLKWILGVMGFFVVVVLLAVFLGVEAPNYEYVGLMWEKEMFGKIPIHSSSITGYSVGGTPINFKMSFRSDPRKLDIPISGELDFVFDNPTYLSIDLDSGVNDCGTLALVSFGRFMGEMRLEVVTAVSTEILSEEHNRPFVNCENMKENTVFFLTKGEGEAHITQSSENPNCYILDVGSKCQDVEVMETLQIAILSRFTNVPLQ